MGEKRDRPKLPNLELDLEQFLVLKKQQKQVLRLRQKAKKQRVKEKTHHHRIRMLNHRFRNHEIVLWMYQKQIVHALMVASITFLIRKAVELTPINQLHHVTDAIAKNGSLCARELQ